MSAAVFAFGKLPRHGDFVARGLSERSRDAWDQWASRGLERARGVLGEAFQDAHTAAPPWRFVFGPGRFGAGWRAGAFAPSIDAAGRRYLVVLGVDGLDETEAGQGPAVAEAMEEVIYQSFASGADVDAMVASARAQLDQAELAPGESGAAARFWTLGGSEHPPQSLDLAEPGPELLLKALEPERASA